MNKQIINNSTALMRVSCAVVFCLFTFCYLYFYQADVMSFVQHVLSGGVTRYERTVGAVLITLVLYLLQLAVFAITRLYKYAHALTYFPSLLCLMAMTDVGISFSERHYGWFWAVAGPILLVVFGWVARSLYKYQPYERKDFTDSPFSRMMWVNMLSLSVMMLLVGLLGSHNDVFHYRLRTEALLRKGEYEKASQVGAKSQATDASLVMLRAYALARQGTLGEHLFEYPMAGGAEAIRPNGKNVRSLFYPELEIHRFLATGRCADDYRLCSYLLEKDLDRFAKSVVDCYDIHSPALPKHYKEALTLYMHKNPSAEMDFHDNVMQADFEDLRTLQRNNPVDAVRKNAIHEVYGNSYWYYYIYGQD